VFIPTVINYNVTENLKEIQDDAKTAHIKADEAKNLAFKIHDDVDKVKHIPKELDTLKQSFIGFETDVIQAKEDSKEAVRNAKSANDKATKVEIMISTLNDISKIKDLDASFLLYNESPFETLKTYLEEIHLNLSNCSELYNDPIIKDVLRQLSLKLHLLSISGFIKNPQVFTLLNQFALELSNKISIPFSTESYNEAIQLSIVR
jgi:hypothetical protein